MSTCVIGPGVLDDVGPVFIACVYDTVASTMSLYTNGALVSSTPNRPLGSFFSLANIYNVHSWLGRSLYNGDASYNGTVDEFRIHDLALGPLQIAVDSAAGPDRVVTDPGPVLSLRMILNTNLSLGAVQQATVLAAFAAVSNVNISSVPGLVIASSDTNVVAIGMGNRLVAAGPGAALITALYQGAMDSATVTVAGPDQTLIHRYSFVSSADDSEGTAHGTLQGGATVTNGVVNLNGSTAYVDLPNNLLTGLTSVTLEAWFVDSGSSGWARVWDFGNSSGGEGSQGGGTSYVFLSCPSGSGGVRGAYKLPGLAEQIVDLGARPSLGVKHHVAWTQDAPSQSAMLFLDGVPAASNARFTSTPAGIGGTVNDWLGRSQYNDPYFFGSIDEFRIYSAALGAAEILQEYELGPEVSPQSGPVAITVQPRDTTVVEQQPATFSAGYIGRRPVRFQWYRNGSLIPGATNASYILSAPVPADSGTRFSVALTNAVANTTFSAVSSNALLTVNTDTVAPTVVRVQNAGLNGLVVVYSEPVEAASATNASHYVPGAGHRRAASVAV